MMINFSMVTLNSLHSVSDRDNWFEFRLISSLCSDVMTYNIPQHRERRKDEQVGLFVSVRKFC